MEADDIQRDSGSAGSDRQGPWSNPEPVHSVVRSLALTTIMMMSGVKGDRQGLIGPFFPSDPESLLPLYLALDLAREGSFAISNRSCPPIKFL